MSTTTLSPLEAANARLLALRASFAADKALSAPPPAAVPPVQEHDSAVQANDIARQESAIADRCASLPAHLGWGSAAVSTHLRQRRGSASPTSAAANKALAAQSIAPIAATDLTPSAAPASVKLYPDIALALLREERVADARVWLLLRALDENGRGVWTRRAAYEKLTRDDAPYRLCGDRQLRKLLERGEGLFWHQDEQKRIWLHSQAKVAAALGIGRLQHKPVALPVPILCQPIGDVRAHFYATFHSARSGGDKPAMPISRQQLTVLSGVSPRTQQTYDSRAAVEATTCIAVGREVTPVLSRVETATSAQLSASVDPQQEAWENGRAGFRLQDHRGQQGERGKVYHAHRLPNSYRGPHAASGHGCRRLNRQLTDLRQKGAGNGQGIQSDGKRPSADHPWTRRYAANGGEGGKVWGMENGRQVIYWRGRKGNRGIVIWYRIPKLESCG